MRRSTVITPEAAITLSHLQLRILKLAGGAPADRLAQPTKLSGTIVLVVIRQRENRGIVDCGPHPTGPRRGPSVVEYRVYQANSTAVTTATKRGSMNIAERYEDLVIRGTVPPVAAGRHAVKCPTTFVATGVAWL